MDEPHGQTQREVTVYLALLKSERPFLSEQTVKSLNSNHGTLGRNHQYQNIPFGRGSKQMSVGLGERLGVYQYIRGFNNFFPLRRRIKSCGRSHKKKILNINVIHIKGEGGFPGEGGVWCPRGLLGRPLPA